VDLEDLRKRLPFALAKQLESLYADFLRHTPKGDTSAFLEWLKERKLVDQASFRRGTDQLELSNLDQTLEMKATEQAKGLENQSLERYQALGVIGEGSVGQILSMQDRHLRRQVAVKQLRSEWLGQPEVLSRFLNEAQIMAQLDHPAIVPVYSLEIQPQGQLAYAMKWVKGKTLKECIREERLKPEKNKQNTERLLDYFLKVCDALDYAHSRGVIHRDLKPANIMIGPYHEVYVMDWGIARRVRDLDQELDQELAEKIAPDQGEPLLERTQMGQVLGTPRYMSPQQAAARNDELDGRTDQFSLGLILYEILTLRPAFQAKHSFELLQKVLQAELEPIPEKLPSELLAILAKATALKPSDRYPSVREFAEDLRCYLRGEAVLARPDTRFQKVLRWIGNRPLTSFSLAVGLGVLCLMGLSFSFYQQQQTTLQIQARERQLAPALSTWARHSQNLSRKLYAQETLLEGFAAPAIAALENIPEQNSQGVLEGLKPLLAQTLAESAAPQKPFLRGQAFAESLVSPQTPLYRAGWILKTGRAIVFPESLEKIQAPQISELKQTKIQWAVLPEQAGLRASLVLRLKGTEVLGTAFADLRFSKLQDWLGATPLKALKAAYLMDLTGKILVASPKAPLELPERLSLEQLRASGLKISGETLMIWNPLPQGFICLAVADLKAILKAPI